MKIQVLKCEKNITLCKADSHNNTFERTFKKVKYALDPESAAIGNMLIENRDDDLCLEITGSCELLFGDDCVIALTGAPYSAIIGEETLPHYCAAQIDKGDRLEIKASDGGCLYIAVNGAFVNKECTAYKAGDEIEIENNKENLYNMDLRLYVKESASEDAPLRLIPGPCAEDFGAHALELLYTSEFTVKGADRKAVSFHGIAIEDCEKLQHLTYAPVGALFIDKDGDPYIIMQDFDDLTDKKIMACVISADMSRLAALAPGSKIRFSPCTVEEAQRLITLKRKEYIRNYLRINTYDK